MSKISFIKSDDRKYNIERCLSLIKSEVIAGVRSANRIVIKPNCVVDNNQLAATNADAIEAVLAFVAPYAKTQITLAEGTGIGETIDAFQNYGYLKLQEKYDLAIVDLNTDSYKLIDLIDNRGRKWKAQVAKTVLDSDYLISVSPPKTHDSVVFTGAVKNVSVGALVRSIPSFSVPINKLNTKMGLPRNNKALIHQGYKSQNINIANLYDKIPLKLAVLDGYEAMQGEGPTDGDMVAVHWAIASSDPIAADWLACQLMGIDINDVGYLTLLNEALEKKVEYFTIGDEWQKFITSFKMHSQFDKMKKWR